MLCITLTITGILLYSDCAAQAGNQSKILFIYMRLKNDVLTLEKTKVVNGKLKQNRAGNDGDLYFEITESQNTKILSRLVRKPGKIAFDYIGDSGQLQGGISEQAEELFVIKVPYQESMKNISFYSTKPHKNSSLANVPRDNVPCDTELKDTLIASFPLNLDTER
jgi:23S rRNA C2498 (ribose-2'-O)-methylase RlmM